MKLKKAILRWLFLILIHVVYIYNCGKTTLSITCTTPLYACTSTTIILAILSFKSISCGPASNETDTNTYTFENDILIVDLNFGNELVTQVTFECDGGKLFMDGEFSHLWRLSSDCN